MCIRDRAEQAFGRTQKIEDTTMGWRFVNPEMKTRYGVDSMPQTAENLVAQFGISREDQDRFALASQQKAAAANAKGFFQREIVPVSIPQRKGEPIIVSQDEHPRPDTTLAGLAKLKPVVFAEGTVTAGNASGNQRRRVRRSARFRQRGGAIRFNATRPHSRRRYRWD